MRAGGLSDDVYGQLSLRAEGNAVPQLPADPAPTQEERNSFESRELTMALRAVLSVDAKSFQRAFALRSRRLWVRADRQLTPSGQPSCAPDLASNLRAMRSARKFFGAIRFPGASYTYPETPEKALILASRGKRVISIPAVSTAGAAD